MDGRLQRPDQCVHHTSVQRGSALHVTQVWRTLEAYEMFLCTALATLVSWPRRRSTPAIGVGPGNAPAYVARDAAVERAADIVASKSFDNGIICGSEQHLIVDEQVAARLRRALQDEGAAVLTAQEVALVERQLFDPVNQRLRRDLVGQSARVLASAAGVAVQPGCRLLVAPPFRRRALAALTGRAAGAAGASADSPGRGRRPRAVPEAALGGGGRAHCGRPYLKPAARAHLRERPASQQDHPQRPLEPGLCRPG